MTPPAPSQNPSEWLTSFCPLGGVNDGNWSPVGAGTLFIDPPIVWLLTTRRVLEAVGDDALTAWVGDGKETNAAVDLTTGRRGSDLDWIRHPELDLAACLFPVAADWNIKAFPESRCLTTSDIQPLFPACAVSCAYGLGPLTGRPSPLVLSGSIASVEDKAGEITATAPILPRNSGSPMLVPLPPQSGGGVALAGIITHTLSVPESLGSTAAPVRLTKALPIQRAIDLVRSEPGKAQRRLAIEASKRAKSAAEASA